MFGSQILDVAIGLILLFLLLSLVCSSMKEGMESFMKFRARDLESGLREMFNDPNALNVIQKFYDHPLIFGLFKGNYDRKKLGNLPSYIPSETFALTVLDLYKQEPENSHLKRFLAPLLEAAGNDARRTQQNVENWYNASMDRVSGWYKRRTQYVIAVLGFAIAIAFNIDAVAIARYLNSNPSVRSAWVEQSRKYATSSPSTAELQQWVNVTDIPVGWTAPSQARIASWQGLPGDLWGWFLKISGILLTGLCVSLGAPFWFDVLNKFMVVRSTVKPEEKSREEPSKG